MNNRIDPQIYSNIGIVAQASWRFFLPVLGKKLIELYGSKIHLYCASELQIESYKSADSEGVFSTYTIMQSDVPGVLPEVLDEKRLFDRATALEEKFGRTINSLNVTNRHLGHGYALGGFYHPRSFLSDESSFAQMVQITVDQLEFWEKEYKERSLTLILNSRSDISVTVADHFKIPVRNIYESRHKSFNNWAIDDKLTNPLIKKAFDEIPDDQDFELIEDSAPPPRGHMIARDMFRDRFSYKGMIKHAMIMIKDELYNRYKGNMSGKYYLISKLTLILRRKRDVIRLSSGSFPTLNDLGDQPYIFFPLHVEPEASLQGQSPEYLSQLTAIVSLSRNLPARYRLVVKEHMGAVGRRPRDFYDQILDLKNVVMLDFRELGKDIVRKSKLVATISGTAGLEAAATGIPVITFGRRNSYNILPHVHLVTDDTQIKPLFDELLSDDYDRMAAAHDGSRYLQAIEQISFDFKTYNHLTGKGFDDQELADCIDKLDISLSQISHEMIDLAKSGYVPESSIG
jgi:hypothetical protein